MNAAEHRAASPPAAVWAAIYVGVAAATLPAVLPVMVGIFADGFGYGLARAGLVASFNMGGILVGCLLSPIVATRLSWPGAVRIALAVMIAGNLLTMLNGPFAYIAATRAFSGLGEGVVAGICYAAMGRAARPERSISIYFGGQSIVGMVGLGSFGWVASTFGWPWIFLLLSLVAVPGFWLADRIGQAQPAPPVPAPGIRFARGPCLALVFILILFVGMASLWPFIERIGTGRGLDTGAVAFALSVSAFGGLAGSAAAGIVAGRLSRSVGLICGLAILAAGIGGLALSSGPWGFAAALWLFAFAWPFQYAFQFGVLAATDPGGRIVALTPAITGGGLTIGPALGGVLLENWGLAVVSLICLACTAIAAGGAMQQGRGLDRSASS